MSSRNGLLDVPEDEAVPGVRVGVFARSRVACSSSIECLFCNALRKGSGELAVDLLEAMRTEKLGIILSKAALMCSLLSKNEVKLSHCGKTK